MFQHIAVDDEVRLATRGIARCSHSLDRRNTGNIVDESIRSIDEPAHQISPIPTVIEDASHSPMPDLPVENCPNRLSAPFIAVR